LLTDWKWDVREKKRERERKKSRLDFGLEAERPQR
jgi:hypothetical protein